MTVTPGGDLSCLSWPNRVRRDTIDDIIIVRTPVAGSRQRRSRPRISDVCGQHERGEIREEEFPSRRALSP